MQSRTVTDRQKYSKYQQKTNKQFSSSHQPTKAKISHSTIILHNKLSAHQTLTQLYTRIYSAPLTNMVCSIDCSVKTEYE